MTHLISCDTRFVKNLATVANLVVEHPTGLWQRLGIKPAEYKTEKCPEDEAEEAFAAIEKQQNEKFFYDASEAS